MKKYLILEWDDIQGGWWDVASFDDFNSALNYVKEHYYGFILDIKYRIVIIKFDTDRNACYWLTN